MSTSKKHTLLKQYIKQLNLNTTCQNKEIFSKRNIIFNESFRKIKDNLMLKEIKSQDHNFIKMLLGTEKLDILYSYDTSDKLINHSTFNTAFNNFISETTLKSSKYSIYTSKFRSDVIENNYNCLGIDYLEYDSNLLYKKLHKGEYIVPCKYNNTFNTFKYKYYLANDFYLNSININGEYLPIWDVNKVRNMDYFDSLLRINPYDSLNYCNTLNIDTNDLFLYLLLCENRWHNNFYRTFYKNERFKGINPDEIFSAVDIVEINNIIQFILQN